MKAITQGLLATIALMLITASPEVLAASAIDFDISRESADKALVQFAQQAGVSVLFPSERISQIKTNPVRGRYELQEALAILLHDTALSAEIDAAAGVLIAKINKSHGGSDMHETKSHKGRIETLMFSIIAAFVGSGRPLYAQTAERSGVLEEVIVTAERRSSDIQKTATSVSVRSGEELAQQGRYTLTDILRDIPNVSGGEQDLSSAGGFETRGNGITIRGVEGNPGSGGGAGAVSGSATTAVYVDGVYEGLGGDYDIQRVEVLRGPQGTLYGRSATSGVVGTYTRDPTLNEVNGSASVQLANYTQQLYTGALNVPIGSNFAVRAAVSKSQADEGYYDGEGGAYDRLHGRVKALYQASDDLSLLLGFAFEENDQNRGGCSGTSSAPGVITYNACYPVATTHNHGRQYWLNMKWDLGPVTLFYQPTLRTYNQGANVVFGPFPTLPWKEVVQTPYDQFHTQELRLASNGDSKLTWQTGFFYYRNNIRSADSNYFVGTGARINVTTSERDTKDYGLFGEATYAFTDATRLTLGARYDYTRVNTRQYYEYNQNFTCNTPIPAAGLPCDAGGAAGMPEDIVIFVVNENTDPSGLRTWRKANYKLRLEHDLTPRNLAYAMVSTGFIPGDVSVSGGGVTPYEAETLTAYEVGSKNRFLDDRLQLNGSAFYYDYGGFQLTWNPDATNPTYARTGAVPARVRGVELESLYQLTQHDRVGLNYAYLETWYVDKPADFAAVTPQKHRPTVPHTINANYEHVFDLPGGSTLSARVDGKFESAYRITNFSTSLLAQGASAYAYVDSRIIGNANLAWSSGGGNYSVGAYVRNFTDEVRISYDTVRSIGPGGIDSSETTPRTYGVILSARF